MLVLKHMYIVIFLSGSVLTGVVFLVFICFIISSSSRLAFLCVICFVNIFLELKNVWW